MKALQEADIRILRDPAEFACYRIHILFPLLGEKQNGSAHLLQTIWCQLLECCGMFVLAALTLKTSCMLCILS